MEMYQKGEKIKVPRDIAPLLEQTITQREKYTAEYRHEVATAFGFGAKEIGSGFQFALDFKDRVAFSYETDPTVRTAEAPMEKIRTAMAKFIIGDHANQIVVSIIEATMEDMVHYQWKLLTDSMELEIIGHKKVPDNKRLQPVVPVKDTGAVQ